MGLPESGTVEIELGLADAIVTQRERTTVNFCENKQHIKEVKTHTVRYDLTRHFIVINAMIQYQINIEFSRRRDFILRSKTRSRFLICGVIKQNNFSERYLLRQLLSNDFSEGIQSEGEQNGYQVFVLDL